MREQIKGPEQLLRWLKENQLREQSSPEILASIEEWISKKERWEQGFRFGATPYYLGLIDWSDPSCPILKQILPSPQELKTQYYEKKDPLAEESNMPLRGLTHRYPDRVLWYLSHQCPVYCRFCLRKRKVSQPESASSKTEEEEVLRYIEEKSEIKEVILSGGDPFSLSDHKIESILERLRNISHLYSIRIHTRMPVTLPMRITHTLTEALRKFYPITVVTHFNHRKEITPEAKEAIRRLRMSGIDVLNQAVLLNKINDTVSLQEELNLELLRAGVRPYYLHRCDEVEGTSHFRVPLQKGLEILKGLRGRNPGISIPRYMIDLPQGGGKIPLEVNYEVNYSEASDPERNSAKGVFFRNWEGKNYEIHE